MILETFLIDKDLALNIFDPYDICKLSVLNKEINILCSRLWKHASIEYFKKSFKPVMFNSMCVKCSRRRATIDRISYCSSCFADDFITRTDSKRLYNLNDEVLHPLFHVEKYIKVYHVNARYYYKHDVIRLALLHHKGPDFSKSKMSAAMKSRLDKLHKLYEKLSIDEDTMDASKYAQCVYNYKRNGLGGIRRVKTALERWDTFDSDVLRNVRIGNLNSDEVSRVKLEYINGRLDDVLAIEELNGISDRRSDLTRELNRYGLSIRTDSYLCKSYILYNEGNISEIVKEMCISNFLYNETTYSSLLVREINNIRSRIRIEHGYLPEYIYHSVLQEHLEPIKRKALLKWIAKNSDKQIPDYIVGLLDQKK